MESIKHLNIKTYRGLRLLIASIMYITLLVVTLVVINMPLKMEDMRDQEIKQSLQDLVFPDATHTLEVVDSKVKRATRYAPELIGRPMTWKEMPYDAEALTCASYDYPLGTKIRVTNLENGRTVDVIVTDRHDYKTDLDLSLYAWSTLRDYDWNDSGNMQVTTEEVQ